MCGRFACGLSADVVRRLSTYKHCQTHQLTEPKFVDLMPENRSFRPSWNIAPTSTCLCLISAKHFDETEDSSSRIVCSMRWSLVPNYFKGNWNEFKFIMNNCRSETIDVKRSFKRPLQNGQRCVILAEGFFEWKKCTPKIPFFIYQSTPFVNEKHYPNINVEKILRNKNETKLPLLAMAGLFDVNHNRQNQSLYSCTICTVDASRIMQDVHVRMPAILSTENEMNQWLDFGRYHIEDVLPLLVPHNDIHMYRVTSNMGSTKVNDMNNIRPIDIDKENQLNSTIQKTTLDSFEIKTIPKSQLIKNEIGTKSSHKRAQNSIEDNAFNEPKATVKRCKK